MGACVYGLDPRDLRDYRGPRRGDHEYTQAFFDARETAMDRLQQDLFQQHPEGSPDAPAGIVGMTVSEAAYGGGQSGAASSSSRRSGRPWPSSRRAIPAVAPRTRGPPWSCR